MFVANPHTRTNIALSRIKTVVKGGGALFLASTPTPFCIFLFVCHINCISGSVACRVEWMLGANSYKTPCLYTPMQFFPCTLGQVPHVCACSWSHYIILLLVPRHVTCHNKQTRESNSKHELCDKILDKVTVRLFLVSPSLSMSRCCSVT